MAQEMCSTSCAGTNTLDASNAYIVHQVSKLDTLAGVAIKYGVEVADVKRLNGLVTDLQMFAHKTLRIPVGRRHPSASTLIKPENSSLSGCRLSSRNGSNLNMQRDARSDREGKGRDKRSPLPSAINLLRGYYGLSSPAAQADGNNARMQLASYKSGLPHYFDEEPFPPIAAVSPTLTTRENGRELEGKTLSETPPQISPTEVVQISGAADASNESSVRRRFKPDAINPPTETCYEVEVQQDMSLLDRMLQVSGLLGGKESLGGLPLAILKVLDGALASSKGKDSPVSKVQKSSNACNLKDQTDPQPTLGTQKCALKVEVKSGAPLNQGVAKASSPNYRFKAAID